MQIVVAMPVYDDWESALKLCVNIDSVLRMNAKLQTDVLLIDDRSTTNPYLSECTALEAIEKCLR
jgi:hypothetical protein